VPAWSKRHPFTIGRTVVLAALLACLITWLRVGDEGDGAIVLPMLALPAGAFVGYFLGLALNRE